LFHNKQKAQVSIETILIIGFLVIGAIVFGVFSISSLNKRTGQATQVITTTNEIGNDLNADAIDNTDYGEEIECVPGSPTPCCGDGICNRTEVCENDAEIQDGLNVCVGDCGVCPPGLCGNGTCDTNLGECFTCKLDCEGSYLCNGMGYCGDGYCNLIRECDSRQDCLGNPDC